MVPGSPFFVVPKARGYLRLSFSNRSESLIESGLRTLGEVVSELAVAADGAAKTSPPALASAP